MPTQILVLEEDWVAEGCTMYWSLRYFVPVVMGPVHEKYIEAVALKSREAALVIENENTFNETMVELFQHKDYREKIGQLASQYVIHQSGATEKILSFLKKQIN